MGEAAAEQAPLLEVDAATDFCEAFTHLRTGAPCADRIGLMNVILAEGINLGLRKMADATNTHTFWELIGASTAIRRIEPPGREIARAGFCRQQPVGVVAGLNTRAPRP